MAARDGIEPSTVALTARCSTAELPGNKNLEPLIGVEPTTLNLQRSCTANCATAAEGLVRGCVRVISESMILILNVQRDSKRRIGLEAELPITIALML